MKPEKNARTQTVETFIQEIEGGHAEDTILIEDNSLIVLPETNKITLSLEKVFMGSDRNFSTDIIITANSIALTVKVFTIPEPRYRLILIHIPLKNSKTIIKPTRVKFTNSL